MGEKWAGEKNRRAGMRERKDRRTEMGGKSWAELGRIGQNWAEE